MQPFTAIIQRYYPERREYLHPILDALAAQTEPPERVILWNNWCGSESWSHQAFPIHTIHSDVNTLMGRYAAALLASTPYVFVQDDDLICDPTVLESLAAGLAMFPRTLFGAFGSNLNRGSKQPYTTGTTICEGTADIVLGRCFAIVRRELIRRLTLLHPCVGRCDDIVLSRQGTNCVVPLATNIFNLDEQGVGLRHDPQHNVERDAEALRLWGMNV